MKGFSLTANAVIVAAVTGTIMAFSGNSYAEKTVTPEGLFRSEAVSTHRVLPRKAYRERSRGVRLNREKLRRGKFFVDLPGDVSFEVVRELQHEMEDGRYAWVGHARGNVDSRAVIGVSGDAVAGTFRYGGKLFKLEPRANGQHVVSEVSPRDPAPEMDPVSVVHPTAFDNGGQGVATSADEVSSDGSIIDVMVAYTPAVVNIYGVDGIQAMIIQAVAETNQAYANSGMATRLNLVHSALTDYTTSGSMLTDLGRLRNTSDGHMDELHALRDQHGADLVSLIDKQSGYCGLAYRMSAVSPFFASSAFSIVNHSCATGYYSFGHELGHNQGVHHDTETAAGSSSAYPYAYGYRDPFGAFRTIMAYNCPGGCVRINHFSNPSIMFNGEPTGAEGYSDNARAIDNSSAVVANFRQSITVQNRPASPSNLNTLGYEDSGIVLSWSDNDTEETGFYIERSKDYGAFSQIASLPANVRSYTDTQLENGSTYTYRVRAWNSVGVSEYSAEASYWIEPTVFVDAFPVIGNGYAHITGDAESSGPKDGNVLVLEEWSAADYDWLSVSLIGYGWLIYVEPGEAVTLHTDAYTDSIDQSFIFSYATTWTQDPDAWTDMFDVSRSSAEELKFTLPSSLSGWIFVGVRDSNREVNVGSRDTLHIDSLYVRSQNPEL